MEEEEAKESRKCAGSGTLDRSEKFGQDRDTLGFPRSTSSGRFGNDRVYGSSRSFKGVFCILPLLIEFARKMYLYLKYLEFVQKDLTRHAIRKEELFKSEEQCFIEHKSLVQISASIFSFIIISLSRENVSRIFQIPISCKSLAQTAIFRPDNFE